MAKLTLKELVQQIREQPYCVRYFLLNSETCLRASVERDWYLLKCSQAGLEPKITEDGTDKAIGEGFTLSYYKGDIILSIDGASEQKETLNK